MLLDSVNKLNTWCAKIYIQILEENIEQKMEILNRLFVSSWCLVS